MKTKFFIVMLLLSTLVSLKAIPNYFGYYHIEGTPFYSGQYIDKYGDSDYINCAVFCTAPIGEVSSDPYTKCRELFAKARAKNIKLWVQVYDAFFFWPGGDKNGDGSAYILSDSERRWYNVKNCIAGYEDVVLGFYFDEPFWCGVNQTNFQTVTQRIRTDFPTKKILAIECGIPVKPSLFGKTTPEVNSAYYNYCTDLGFDTYDKTWDSGDYNILFAAIKDKAANGQSIWVVPAGSLEFQSAYTVSDNLLKWYQISQWDSRVAGIIIYTLSSAYGAEGSDELIDSDSYYKTMHMAIGRSITWGSSYKNLWNSQLDFAATQGSNGWLYQYWDGSNFVNMTYNSAGYWEAGTYAKIYTTSMMPDAGKATTLTWVAPKAGTIRVNLKPRKASWSTCGDGVFGGIYKNLILQKSFGVSSTDITGTPIQLIVNVQANDKIQFQISRNTNTDCDMVIIDPTISYSF